MSNVIQLYALRASDIPAAPASVTVVTLKGTGFKLSTYLGHHDRRGSGASYFLAENKTEWVAGHNTYSVFSTLKNDLRHR